MQRAVLGLGCCCLILGCGAAPAAPVANARPEPAPSAAAKPADAVREASSDLRRYWAFGAEPEFALYGDLDSLLHTELFETLVPAVINVAGDTLRGKQKNCVDALVAGTREIAVAAHGRAAVALVGLSEDGMRAARSTCIGVLFPVDRIKVDGANEAYAMDEGVVVVEPGVALIGDKLMVEAALSAQGANWPHGLELHADQHAAFNLALKDQQLTGHNVLSVDSQRFRIEFETAVPSEELAKTFEEQFAGIKVAANMAVGSTTPGENPLDAVTLKRDGQRLTGTFEVHGSTAEQASQLGTMAAFAINGAKKYLQQSKMAEARTVVGAIAKSYATALDEPSPLAKSNPKKKLASLPAVPAAIPRGVKYQSSASDWAAWDAIHFSLSHPQYYQYEVVAAKDGNSAEIIARGDLNGDGKSSQFRLKVSLDPKTKHLNIAAAPDETDPSE
ncbi:MAG TPA: hypothetical protein VGM29_14265 [Polyangiaceae bacterium]